MKYVFLFLLLPLGAIAQEPTLYSNQWTLYPNYDLDKKLEVGDSLIFIVNDSTLFNPEITLSVNSDHKSTVSLTSFSYPTEKGIVLSTDDPEPTYTITRDTILREGSIEIVEYKAQNHIQVLHGPCNVNVCILNEEIVKGVFSCSILVGYGKDGVIEGPFHYSVKEGKLILIKQ